MAKRGGESWRRLGWPEARVRDDEASSGNLVSLPLPFMVFMMNVLQSEKP